MLPTENVDFTQQAVGRPERGPGERLLDLKPCVRNVGNDGSTTGTWQCLQHLSWAMKTVETDRRKLLRLGRRDRKSQAQGGAYLNWSVWAGRRGDTRGFGSLT